MIALIIQARRGSTRYPDKVLVDLDGLTMLDYLIRRMNRVRPYPTVIVGTTTDPADDAVADIADLAMVDCHRWPVGQTNILAGYLAASRTYDTIVRVTADCPLLATATVEMLVARFRLDDCDHVEARGMPDGTWCEVVSRETLQRIAAAPDLTDEEREHVTLYARRRPDQFRLGFVDTMLDLDDERWVVDTSEDLAFVRRVVESGAVTFGEQLAVVQAHPEWRVSTPRSEVETRLYAARQIGA